MSRRVRAVLLDMGGVLVPEVSSFERAAKSADLLARLREWGSPEPVETIRDAARSVREAYRALDESCTQPDLDAALAGVPERGRRRLLSEFAAVADRRPYAHALPVLEKLAGRYRLGVVSNNIIPGDHHLRTLRRAGLMRHVGCALWSANFGRRKPDPAMIRHALDRLGVPARHAVFVGDKIRTDVLAARRAGVRSIHLRRRGQPATGAAVPDHVIRHLGELPLLLRGLA